MSSTIIYERNIVKIAGNFFGHDIEDQYLVLEISGASNTYDMDNRRVRDKTVMFFGKKDDVVAYAIAEGRYFDNGCSFWRNKGKTGSMTWAQWIRKMKRLLEIAPTYDPYMGPNVGLDNVVYCLSSAKSGLTDAVDLMRNLHKLSLTMNAKVAEFPRWFNEVKVR